MQTESEVRKRGPGVTAQIPMQVVRSLALVGEKTAEKVEQGVEALLGDPMESSGKGGSARMHFGDWTKAYLWAPFDNPNYPLRWAPLLITWFHTFVLATVLAVSVTITASIFTSVITGLNALGISIVTFGVLLLGMSVRSADRMPQLMHPALVCAENVHGHIGLFPLALPMLGLMLAGAALSAPILKALGGTFLPNYATAVRPITYWGAVALQTPLVAFAVYMFQFNTPFKHYHLAQGTPKRKNSIAAFKKTSIFFSLANAIAIWISYANGLYSVGNFVVTFGSYINTGNWSVPDTAACTLDLAWPFVGGLAGWALHLLTYNVKGLTSDEMAQAVEDEAEDAEA